MGDQDLHAASAEFYAALRRLIAGDEAAMDDVWSHEPAVVAMHPLGGRQVGWQAVRASWAQVASLHGDAQIRLFDESVERVGDLGIVTGTEGGRLEMGERSLDYAGARVTNVFRLVGGRWKAILHHVDESPSLTGFLRGESARQPVGAGH